MSRYGSATIKRAYGDRTTQNLKGLILICYWARQGQTHQPCVAPFLTNCTKVFCSAFCTTFQTVLTFKVA